MKTKCSGSLALITMSSLVLATTLTGCTAVPDQQVSTVTPPVQPDAKAKGKDKKKKKEDEQQQQQTAASGYHGGTSSVRFSGGGGGRTWWWPWSGSSQPSTTYSGKGTQVSGKGTASSSGGRAVGSVARGGFGWGGFFAGG